MSKSYFWIHIVFMSTHIMLKTYCMIYVVEYFFAAGVIYTSRYGLQSFLYGQTLNESLAPN
jgi:hypothetical protein